MKNLRDLAVAVCKLEGKKKQVNIAQMSETLSCLGKVLAAKPASTLSLLAKSAGFSIRLIVLDRENKKPAKKKKAVKRG